MELLKPIVSRPDLVNKLRGAAESSSDTAMSETVLLQGLSGPVPRVFLVRFLRRVYAAYRAAKDFERMPTSRLIIILAAISWGIYCIFRLDRIDVRMGGSATGFQQDWKENLGVWADARTLAEVEDSTAMRTINIERMKAHGNNVLEAFKVDGQVKNLMETVSGGAKQYATLLEVSCL